MIEFEVKARVPQGDEARVRAALGPARATLAQSDVYLAHPARDFAATDEALRVRTAGGATEVTYKGPKMDRETKTRRELTLTVPEGEAEALALFEALGFRPVLRVDKTRTVHDYADFTASFDEIAELGAFVELERALPEGAPTADAREDARRALAALGLAQTERRSYLELLVEARGRKV